MVLVDCIALYCIGRLCWLKKRMLILDWLKNRVFRTASGARGIGVEPMLGPNSSLKRKLDDALSNISASSADLAEKRRACEEPLQQIKDNLAALPVFVFICNI